MKHYNNLTKYIVPVYESIQCPCTVHVHVQVNVNYIHCTCISLIVGSAIGWVISHRLIGLALSPFITAHTPVPFQMGHTVEWPIYSTEYVVDQTQRTHCTLTPIPFQNGPHHWMTHSYRVTGPTQSTHCALPPIPFQNGSHHGTAHP